MRGYVAPLTVGFLLAGLVAGSAHATATPRYHLLGDWSFHGDRYRFRASGTTLSGRSLTSVRIGHCLVRRGTVVFNDYRFRGTRAGVDYWRGRLALVGGTGCSRKLVSSTITLENDLHFSESSTLPGGRPVASTFSRVRPPVSSSDPVIGTWLRNGAGVVVMRDGRLYVGRAQAAFTIANGCTVPAGTVIWRMRPLAPDLYSGTIQTFLGPPGCQAGAVASTTWRLGLTHAELIRESPEGQAFPYTRA